MQDASNPDSLIDVGECLISTSTPKSSFLVSSPIECVALVFSEQVFAQNISVRIPSVDIAKAAIRDQCPAVVRGPIYSAV